MLEDVLREHRDLVEKDGVKQLQARRRIALDKVTVPLPTEAKSRMDRVHKDAPRVRQAIQIGVNESTSGRQEENASSQIHEKLGGMHENLRLAGPRSPAQKGATPLHVGVQVPFALDAVLLPNEIEEANLIRGPLRRIPERLAANNGVPFMLQAGEVGRASPNSLATEEKSGQETTALRSNAIFVVSGEPHVLRDHAQQLVLAVSAEGPIREGALPEDVGAHRNVEISDGSASRKVLEVEKRIRIEVRAQAAHVPAQRAQIHQSSDQAATALEMRQHEHATRAADEGLGPRVRHQHGEELPKKAVAGDAAIANAHGQGALLPLAVLHSKTSDLLHGAKPREKRADEARAKKPMKGRVTVTR